MINERSSILNLLHPGLVFHGKDLVEKVGKPLCQSACFRVGKLGAVPDVSLEQQERKRESAGWARGDGAHQDPQKSRCPKCLLN